MSKNIIKKRLMWFGLEDSLYKPRFQASSSPIQRIQILQTNCDPYNREAAGNHTITHFRGIG